jgi:ketosteroid isomerase-like protein
VHEIVELDVLGTHAFLRNRLTIRITAPGAQAPMVHEGYTLTVLRKTDDGKWKLMRDANLLTARAP